MTPGSANPTNEPLSPDGTTGYLVRKRSLSHTLLFQHGMKHKVTSGNAGACLNASIGLGHELASPRLGIPPRLNTSTIISTQPRNPGQAELSLQPRQEHSFRSPI
ncbi:hypothetical protein CEP54_005999 [Fusarium duplospermum]|uniref:Uncharacterized protein n=1 Tax=Fusarium duplospermum TaxID=1325734 RepID=A0A428Q9J7_9HYPO|nr:hypothetical protein CEP54_005999 [Fusarium duplospermum]